MVQTQGTDALFPQRPRSYLPTDRVRSVPHRIAVIEEDATLQQFMSTLLTDEGYTVIEWGSAEGAHALIRSEHPDAVLLDLRLEDAWSGMRLAEELHHDPATTDTPVVMMTGDRRFRREHRDDLARLNCDVAVMPFNLNDLLETIGHCIAPD